MIFGLGFVERRFWFPEMRIKGRDYHMSVNQDPNAGKGSLPQLSIPVFASFKSACFHGLVLDLLFPNFAI
jgi:hypothetical protein